MARWAVEVGDITRVDGTVGTVPLRPRERAVVSALALLHPAAATAADIASLMWGADIPLTGRKAVHNHVLRVRRAAPGLVETTDGGYRFGSDVEVAVRAAEHAFGELADLPRVAIERAMARERHLIEVEMAAHDLIVSLDADEACARAAALVDAEPQRVIRWEWWIVSTARLGRRRRALDLIRSARAAVDRDGTGTIDDELDELEQIVLTDDPILDSNAVVRAPATRRSATWGAVGHLDPGGEGERLRTLLARGDVTSVSLTAPSGAGKTSLCRHVGDALAASGWSVTWCAIARGVDATLAFEQLADDLELRLGPGGSRHPEALIDRLERAVSARAPRPRLIVVDDVQFLTGDRLDWVVRLLAAAAGALDTTVLVTSRDDEVVPVALAGHHHRLLPWNLATVEMFVHHFVQPSRWTRSAAEWIHRRSGGNALFVRELTLDVVASAPTDVHADAFEPPDRSESASSAAALRLGQLGEPTRRVLAGAALWGRRFDPRDLSGEASTIERAMAEAHAAGVVERRDDATSRFRHDAYRDALLGDVDDEMMGAVGPAAGNASADAAIAAAERAVAERRLNDATRLYRRAADMVREREGRGERLVEAMVDLGATSLSVGADDAIDVLLDAARSALDLGLDRAAGRALRHLCRTGPTSVVGGHDARVLPLVERALATVNDPAARAFVATAATGLYGFANDADRSRDLYDEAVEAAHRSGDPDVIAEVLRSGYMSILRPHEVELRRSTADELDRLAMVLGRDDLRYEACRVRISVVTELGEADPRPYFREVERLAERFGERSRNWGLFSFASMIEFLDGDLERSEATLMRLTGDDVVASPSLVIATVGAHLLGLRLAADRVAELGLMVDDLVERQPEVSAWRAVRALTLAHTDRVDSARRCFDSVLPPPGADGPSDVPSHDALPHDVTRVPSIVCLGRAAIRLGDTERAGRVLSLLEPHAGRWSWHGTGTYGPVDLELALLHRTAGDAEQSRLAATRALASAVRVGAPSLGAAAASLLVDHPAPTTSTVHDRR